MRRNPTPCARLRTLLGRRCPIAGRLWRGRDGRRRDSGQCAAGRRRATAFGSSSTITASIPGSIVPVVGGGRRLARARFRRATCATRAMPGIDHVAIGWGERAFYVETPTWADVRPATSSPRRSAAAGRWCMSTGFRRRARQRCGAIVLRPEEYRRLAAFIRASIVAGRRAVAGYGDADAFYEARGHYSALQTCNAWTGDALRAGRGADRGRGRRFR